MIEIAQKVQSDNLPLEYIVEELKGIMPDVHAYKIRNYANALVADYKTRRLNKTLSQTVLNAGTIDRQIGELMQELEALKSNDIVMKNRASISRNRKLSRCIQDLTDWTMLLADWKAET